MSDEEIKYKINLPVYRSASLPVGENTR